MYFGLYFNETVAIREISFITLPAVAFKDAVIAQGTQPYFHTLK